jgi:hypothetical protein
MAFEWLQAFQRDQEKPADYAEKTLAAYALGMKARGAIVGVTIEIDPEGCMGARQLTEGAVYDPTAAPRLPLAGCSRGARCRCVYRPVMSYQRQGEP